MTNTFSLDLDKLSDEELNNLSYATKLALHERVEKNSDEKSISYIELENEKSLLEKEIKSVAKNSKKFTFTINLPLTFEVNQHFNDTKNVFLGVKLFYYEGKIKFPKTFDGLTKDQSQAINRELSNYDTVCDYFLTHFIPKDISSVGEVLAKKCAEWIEKVERENYNTSDFLNETDWLA